MVESSVETTVVDVKPDIQTLVLESEAMALQYQAYSVTDNETLLLADNALSKIKSRIAELENERLEITRPMDASKKRIMALFSKPIDALTMARTRINAAMSTYRNEQDRIRQEQERKLQEMARKEEDRKRKALEDRAAKAAANGNTDKAAELLEKAEQVYVPAPVVQSSVVATKNKPRDVWQYEITNVSLVPREWMIPNDLLLGKQARATHDSLTIPGVRFYKVESKF